MNWLISANSSMFDHSTVFEHFGFIDWKQGSYKFQVDDTVYIYSTNPTKRIQYKCKVEKINLSSDQIQKNEEYWIDKLEYERALTGKYMRISLVEQVYNSTMTLEKLIANGLKAAPQGSKKLDGDLLKYIERNFNDKNQNDIFPDTVNEDEDAYEGIKKSVVVNKYERSSVARNRCIEHHGTKCKVCELDFEDMYGEVGKGFIHVHHVIPIHRIGKEYKVDYRSDLIPVCPNCHAMLHRKVNGNEISVAELKTKIKK